MNLVSSITILCLATVLPVIWTQSEMGCPSIDDEQNEEETKTAQLACLRAFFSMLTEEYSEELTPRTNYPCYIVVTKEKPNHIETQQYYRMDRSNRKNLQDIHVLNSHTQIRMPHRPHHQHHQQLHLDHPGYAISEHHSQYHQHLQANKQLHHLQHHAELPCVLDPSLYGAEIAVVKAKEPDLKNAMISWSKRVGERAKDECVVYSLCQIGWNPNDFGRVGTDLVNFFRNPTIYLGSILQRYSTATRLNVNNIDINKCKDQLEPCLVSAGLGNLVKLGFPYRY